MYFIALHFYYVLILISNFVPFAFLISSAYHASRWQMYRSKTLIVIH